MSALFPTDAYVVGAEGWTLCLGSCLDAVYGLPTLADQSIDVVLDDPQYGKRTHEGQTHERAKKTEGDEAWASNEGLGYEFMSPEEAKLLATHYVRIARRWILVMTSHDLFPVWEHELKQLGHYVFAPVPIVIPGMDCRLQGDGPSGWSVWLVVARPRINAKWGTKPGAYICNQTGQDGRVKGSKPPGLMQALVRDYTKRGESILDPHTGSGTTGVAAVQLGRPFVGYELMPKHFDIARKKLAATRFQLDLLDKPITGKQMKLLGDEKKPSRRSELDDAVLTRIGSAGEEGVLAMDLHESMSATKGELRGALSRLMKSGRVRLEGQTVNRRYFLLDSIDPTSCTPAFADTATPKEATP